MTAPGGRMRRVDEAMREVLSTAVQDLKDPRIGFVTITGVDTAPDLQHASVWFSVLGDDSQRELTRAALQSAHGILQRAIASQLRMKKTPQLEFAYDDTAERADRLERLLAEADADE